MDLTSPRGFLGFEDEAERLSALRNCAILDTAPEGAFDDVARLASALCGAPIALVSFVDEHRQWFKATAGLAATETPRNMSFCAHAIGGDGLFVVENAAVDPRFCGNALVIGPPYIRFYAGAVLETSDGFRLGTVCVIDTQPRPEGLTSEQGEGLNALARVVVDQLALKHINRQLAENVERNLKRELMFDLALSKMNQGLCFFGGDHRLIVCNSRYSSMYGLKHEDVEPGTLLSEIVGRRYEVGTGPESTPAKYLGWREEIARDSQPSDTTVNLSNGRVIRVHHEPMLDGGWVATHEDITAEAEVRERLRRLAFEDPLTGLPNRRRFSENFDAALSAARSNGSSVSLLLFDLDDFKDVNDVLGHDAGDALLQEAAFRLGNLKRECDAIARIGGDEFAMILVEPFTFDNAVSFAEHLLDSVRTPFNYEGHLIATRMSIGVASYPDHDATQSELMKDADIALYRAKALGRNRVVSFSSEMRAAAERQMAVIVEAREGLLRGEFLPFYQPKVCLRSGRIVGFEALARWQHPARGLVTPGYFGEAFRDAEFAEMIGEVMLDKVTSELSTWIGSGLDCGRVALNFSSTEFAKVDLADIVLETLARRTIPVENFEVEVTEGVFLGATSDNVLRALSTFDGAGVKVALDDFGTGFASLTHLKQFPIHHIKIDQSFVRGLGKDTGDEAIVSSVIGLARNMGMHVTAEGVETPEQASWLREIGCDYAQGYLLAKPMIGTRVPHFMQNWSTSFGGIERVALARYS